MHLRARTSLTGPARSLALPVVIGLSALGLTLPDLATGQTQPAQRSVAERLQRLDADGDGQVTLAEFQVGPQDRFAALDTNGDALLVPAELAAAMAPAGADPAKVSARIAQRIERLDTDGDGALSLEEIGTPRRAPNTRLFDRLDTNGDDILSAAEIAAADGLRRRAGARDGQ